MIKVKKSIYIIFACLSLVLISHSFTSNVDEVNFYVPKGWPKPQYVFKNNKVSQKGFALGRALFYDPILSADSSTSCASCHLSFTAFTHPDHSLSHGIQGLVGNRNSLSLINLAWNKTFMWDGGVTNLEMQAINPITNPVEMNSKLTDVISKLNASKKYRAMFYQVYKDSAITTPKLLKSLAQFTANLVSYNSKYDSVMRQEPNVQFTTSEARGYALFKTKCASCHVEPLFTNFAFENNGLPMDKELKDIGRMKITNKVMDSLKFRVPTLRNIEFSAPYFHDGRFNKLKEVVEHYSSGILHSSTLSKSLAKPLNFSKEEKKDLINFLKTLTDKSFLYNVNYRSQN